MPIQTANRGGITRRALGMAALAGLGAGSARAQAWPNKPIRLIAPFAAGGPADVVCRYLGRGLTQDLGQPVVIDNVTGATGLIGAAAAARAEPDGHTFVYTNVSMVITSGFMLRSRPVAPLTDLLPVVRLGIPRHVLLVQRSLGVSSVRELLALAKARREGMTYGSFGVGSSVHLYGEILRRTADADVTHVPYRGFAPALQDLMAGRLDMLFIEYAAGKPAIDDGKVIPLAIVGPQRSPRLPDLPTVGEAGLPIDVLGWIGFHAPLRTPAIAVERFSASITRQAASPEGNEILWQAGLEATPAGSEEFAAAIARDVPRWGSLIRSVGIEPQ